MDKDTRQLVAKLKRQNFHCEITGNNHIKVYPADCDKFVTIPSSASDFRGKKNAISELRKIGYKDK